MAQIHPLRVDCLFHLRGNFDPCRTIFDVWCRYPMFATSPMKIDILSRISVLEPWNAHNVLLHNVLLMQCLLFDRAQGSIFALVSKQS